MTDNPGHEVAKSAQGTSLSTEELEQVLVEHKTWLESGKLYGKQANLEGLNLRGAYLCKAVLIEANLRAANLANANLTEANLERAEMSAANLFEASLFQASLVRTQLIAADLSKAILYGANCQSADLEGANLKGANLSTANLFGAQLKDADLRSADLTEAKLEQTQLLRANLREADLQDADLKNAKCLLGSQLAACNVSGAKLPDAISKFEGLSQVEELSKNAKRLFISVLLGCIYCWLTIATTTDVRLLTNSVSSPLPIIQSEIPIVGFYWIAPIMLMSAYLYLHLYLQRLWEGLADLPAIFPDGRPLDKKVYPWLLNGLVHSAFSRLRNNRPSLSRLQVAIATILAWWVVPLTFIFFWIRYLPRHDWYGTGLHLMLLVISIIVAIGLYRLATKTLHGVPSLSCSRDRELTVALTVTVLVLFGGLSYGAIEGVKSQHMWRTGGYVHDELPVRVREEGLDLRLWVPRFLGYVGRSPFAEFTAADVSSKPPDWTGYQDSRFMLVKGANLKGANLSYANGPRAFWVRADLSDANLRGGFLVSGDLREANLMWANLSGSFLFDANLKGANLREANLSMAHLDNADLMSANLERANLQGVSLANASLVNATLFGANLDGALLSGANLERTNLKSANLKNVSGLTKKQISEAITDKETKFPDRFE